MTGTRANALERDLSDGAATSVCRRASQRDFEHCSSLPALRDQPANGPQMDQSVLAEAGRGLARGALAQAFAPARCDALPGRSQRLSRAERSSPPGALASFSGCFAGSGPSFVGPRRAPSPTSSSGTVWCDLANGASDSLLAPNRSRTALSPTTSGASISKASSAPATVSWSTRSP